VSSLGAISGQKTVAESVVDELLQDRRIFSMLSTMHCSKTFLSQLSHTRQKPSVLQDKLIEEKKRMNILTMQILAMSNIFPFIDIKKTAYIVGRLVQQGLSACDTPFPSSSYPP
jgi:hypothetical protein